MQTEDQVSKSDRQKLVASLVERRRIGTQQELIDALAGVGCVVTQATVSRDIRELGLEKARDALGTLRYVLPNRERRVDPRETLDSLLGSSGAGSWRRRTSSFCSRRSARPRNRAGARPVRASAAPRHPRR